MQRGVVKLEHCPVAVGKEEQQLLDEVQEGSVVCKFCADPVENVWSDQGCVSELDREHYNWSAALKDYLSCLWICLQVQLKHISLFFSFFIISKGDMWTCCTALYSNMC